MPTLVAPRTAKASAAARTYSAARRAVRGDIAPNLASGALEAFTAGEATEAAEISQLSALQSVLGSGQTGADKAKALRALLDGASSDDLAAIEKQLLHARRGDGKHAALNPDEALADNGWNGGYPYKNLILRASYEREKYRLQVELLKLQAWVKAEGQRVVILFEGRDAADKGGTIKRMMEHLNPRGARVVALEKPTSTEQGQW